MVNRKHVFWQALLVCLFIFGIGIILGIYFENYRATGVNELALKSEVSLLDSQLMGGITDEFNLSCPVLKQRIVDFADQIYYEAKLLETYDDASQLTDILTEVHKKYDLLRVLLWTETIKFNSKCKDGINTIIYIYDYDNPSSLVASEQLAFARFIGDLKQKNGNKLVLIPIAGDLGLSSVELIKANYLVKDLPVVIVNEKEVIKSISELEDIQDSLFE